MKRKAFILTAVFLFVFAMIGIPQSFALNTYLDVGTDNNADGDSLTGIFNVMEFEDETKTTFAGAIPTTVGGSTTFSDFGHALISSLKFGAGAPISDNENMRTDQYDPTGSSWEMTMDWTGLTGTITNETANTWSVEYDPGTIFTLYFDTTPDADWGSDDRIPDDGSSTGFDDGVIELTAKVLSGSGFANGLAGGVLGRNLALNYEIVSVTAGFMFAAPPPGGVDLNTLFSTPGLLAFSTEGTDPLDHILTDDGAGNTVLYAQGDGSFQINVVPEPSTMLLLGFGLLGCSAIGRRKFLRK